MHPHEHPHSHGHEHAHGPPVRHPPQPDLDSAPPTYHEKLEAAVRELLIAKKIITAEDVRAAVENIEGRSPSMGAKVVARAWVDPKYKARLLANGPRAVEELGIDMGAAQLVVVENTPTVHNLIVCTLCSCYPRPVLGLPPVWYKSRAYRSRAVREPRAVLAEFGTVLPGHVVVRVHDSTADMRYMVLPMRPAGTEGFSEEKLAELVTRDSMIGVTVIGRR
jgi:nitrile hydratase